MSSPLPPLVVRPFDLTAYLRGHGVLVVTEGGNVKRGDVNIACPLCLSDPSAHLGICLEPARFGQWACWRDSSHRGKNLLYILSRVIGVSKATIREELASVTNQRVDGEGRSRWAQLVQTGDPFVAVAGSQAAERSAAVWPVAEFFSLADPENRWQAQPFLTYLTRNPKRRFAAAHVPTICTQYGLHGALSGRYHHRLIIPFRRAGKVTGWTGRALNDTLMTPRYDTMNGNQGRTVWNLDAIVSQSPRLVVITEGPLDAMKMDFYGQGLGVRAVCTFGVRVQEQQTLSLWEALAAVPAVCVLFDPAAEASAQRLAAELAPLQRHAVVRVGSVPPGVQDPGAMTPQQVEAWCHAALAKQQ